MDGQINIHTDTYHADIQDNRQQDTHTHTHTDTMHIFSTVPSGSRGIVRVKCCLEDDDSVTRFFHSVAGEPLLVPVNRWFMLRVTFSEWIRHGFGHCGSHFWTRVLYPIHYVNTGRTVLVQDNGDPWDLCMQGDVF